MRYLLIFFLGLAAGAAGMAFLRPAPLPAPAEQASAPPPPPTRAKNTAQGDGTVTVVLESGTVSKRVPGVVVREPAALIVRFDDYVRSERAYWISANGLRHAIDEATAVDLDIGLIAFAVDEPMLDGLTLSSDRGSLFLGLDVTLIGDQPGSEGEVYSAAVERGPNHYRYQIRSDSPPAASLIAVVDTSSGALIGLADRPRQAPASPVLSAVDVGTLVDFLANRLPRPARTMTDINAAIFSQPAGLAREFEELSRSGRWSAALDRARRLIGRSPEYITWLRRGGLFENMVRQSQALVTTGRSLQARTQLLDDIQRFGANQDVLRELVRIETRRGATLDAIATLDQLQYNGVSIPKDDLFAVMRATVTTYLGSPEKSDARATQLLLDQLQRDPDYAPYHRQLGSLLFASGRYQEAEFHLNRAVALDPSYAADVARELETARQRRQVTRQVEVPLIGSGSALYVNVQLNGSPQTFRFLLDTGASYSAINTSTLLRLGLNDIFNNGAPVIELETANGRVFAQTFRLQSMNLAGAVVEQVPVVVLEDMGPLDGLVGLSFLRHFDVEINQQDGVLILLPR